MKKQNCIIAISHSNYLIKSAGIEKFLKEEESLLEQNNIKLIHIFPVIEINKILSKLKMPMQYVGINLAGKFKAIVEINKLTNYILKILKQNKLNPIGIQIHHLHGWDTVKLIAFIHAMALPVKIYIHDYDTVSPYIMCNDVASEYKYNIKKVSLPQYKNCKYYEAGKRYYQNIKLFFNAISNEIVQIYVPSDNTFKIWTSYFKEYKSITQIRPHAIYKLINNFHKISSPLKIAYLGSTAEHKGYKEWKYLIKHLPSTKYTYYYFGSAKVNDEGVISVFVDFQRKDLPNMVEQLKQNNIDIAFMWSKAQETFCYTFYEAITAGAFVLSNDQSGNIADEIKKNNYGKTFGNIGECISYLNSDKVYLDLENYVNKSKIPQKLLVNNDIESLSFKNKEWNIKPMKTVHSNFIISKLYQVLRVKNEN